MNVSILLWIKTFMFLNGFVSFRYWKLYYRREVKLLLPNFRYIASTFLHIFPRNVGQNKYRTRWKPGQGMQDMRNAWWKVCRKWEMHNRNEAGLEECTTQGMKNIRNAWREGCTKGGMQGIRNVRQDMRSAWQDRDSAWEIYDRRGAGHEECTTGGQQDMKNA